MDNTKLVITFVGTVFMVALCGIIVLAVRDQNVPDVLQNIAVGSMTLLGGLLVPAKTPPE
ncbi:hypothetical protein [Nocardioides sp. Soil796]|uniref:hypothetical protein n=1 Tax=Nocardioides sp. Soil796 TaxID=1736412 RepID=UPI0007097EB6|nr:hypothetical protein [Nocardioides sp. Soil796]KRF19666.1 hypothetical protein ASH02_24230 [Nocardioides sp. Soil796]